MRKIGLGVELLYRKILQSLIHLKSKTPMQEHAQIKNESLATVFACERFYLCVANQLYMETISHFKVS